MTRQLSPALRIQSAIRYANQVAEDIVTNAERQELRNRIVILFTDGKMTSAQIAAEVNGSMELRKGVKDTTASSIVRRVLEQLVPDDVRSQVHKVLHANSLARHQVSIGEKRDTWMLKQGYLVWTDDHRAFFLQLLAQADMKRGQSDIYNHTKLAAAMRKQFPKVEFDEESTRRQLERLRLTREVPQSTVKRARKQRAG